MPRSARLEDGIALTLDEFRLLRDLFAAKTGLSFGPEARFALERRLRDRLVVLKLASFTEYHHYLQFGVNAGAEWDEAVDLLTTNETYFFREGRQLRAFQNELLPLVRAAVRTSRRLSIWSVGSSTGEEAYTIAILLHQVGLDARVYGQDISRRCVAAARRGVYAESSFRATPDEIRRAFFQERPDGWHVVDAIRQTCHFGQVNLLDERSPPIGRGDVIFCRNVLIYFDDRARKAAVERLYRRLNPGGILLLGHSESLLNVPTAFELLHLKDDLVYRKPPRLAWRP